MLGFCLYRKNSPSWVLVSWPFKLKPLRRREKGEGTVREVLRFPTLFPPRMKVRTGQPAWAPAVENAGHLPLSPLGVVLLMVCEVRWIKTITRWEGIDFPYRCLSASQLCFSAKSLQFGRQRRVRYLPESTVLIIHCHVFNSILFSTKSAKKREV